MKGIRKSVLDGRTSILFVDCNRDKVSLSSDDVSHLIETIAVEMKSMFGTEFAIEVLSILIDEGLGNGGSTLNDEWVRRTTKEWIREIRECA